MAIAGAVPAATFAQSAIDAYNLTQSDLRGTARFMSMAGAFGALGGDLSTLNQNPAGIGVYRGSDFGITLDINMTSSKTNAGYGTTNMNKTNVFVNNFGYIGTAKIGSEAMPTFSWGATYNRAASFDRVYSGYVGQLNTSMSNYIANFTNGYSPDVLGEDSNYNPFSQSDAPWLSIMAYNSYMINPTGVDNGYNGLYVPGYTSGNSEFTVRERGYVDEYSINFGGNVMNTLYWGIGFGITDISLTQNTSYDEELTDADVYNKDKNVITPGNSYNMLQNAMVTTGNGYNVKLGVILKPINEFRIGLAFHTPTWYNVSTRYISNMSYSYGYNFNASGNPEGSNMGDYESDEAYYDWHLRSPWRLMASVAGVIDGRFIISADYEYKAFNDMSVSIPGTYGNYSTDTGIRDDVKSYFKPTNTLRLGAEYRITPQFSVRAGYSYSSTSVENSANDGSKYIMTAGTNPSYTMNKDTQYITCGLGYRFGGFYVDAAFVHKTANSTWHAFSSFTDTSTGKLAIAPTAEVTNNNNDLVFTVGYKF